MVRPTTDDESLGPPPLVPLNKSLRVPSCRTSLRRRTCPAPTWRIHAVPWPGTSRPLSLRLTASLSSCTHTSADQDHLFLVAQSSYVGPKDTTGIGRLSKCADLVSCHRDPQQYIRLNKMRGCSFRPSVPPPVSWCTYPRLRRTQPSRGKFLQNSVCLALISSFIRALVLPTCPASLPVYL